MYSIRSRRIFIKTPIDVVEKVMTWITDPSMKTQSNGKVFPGGFDLTYQIIKLIKVIENIVKIETNINRITCWYDSIVILLV